MKNTAPFQHQDISYLVISRYYEVRPDLILSFIARFTADLSQLTTVLYLIVICIITKQITSQTVDTKWFTWTSQTQTNNITTRFMWWMQTELQVAANPQTKPT